MADERTFEYEEVPYEGAPPAADRRGPGGPPPGPKGEGLGCFFWGCITVIVLAILGSVGLFFITRYSLRGMVEPLTSTQRTEIPDVEYTQAEADALRERVDAFNEAIDRDEAAELELTGQELNILIEEDPDLQQVADYVYVDIQDEELSGEISFPLADLGEAVGLFRVLLGRDWMEQRYFHGKAIVNVSVEDGQPDIELVSIESEGEPLPDDVQRQIRSQFEQQQIEQEMMSDPETREAMRRIERLEVADGRLLVRTLAADEMTTPTEGDAATTETQGVPAEWPDEADGDAAGGAAGGAGAAGAMDAAGTDTLPEQWPTTGTLEREQVPQAEDITTTDGTASGAETIEHPTVREMQIEYSRGEDPDLIEGEPILEQGDEPTTGPIEEGVREALQEMDGATDGGDGATDGGGEATTDTPTTAEEVKEPLEPALPRATGDNL